jgi:hypothetical protein
VILVSSPCSSESSRTDCSAHTIPPAIAHSIPAAGRTRRYALAWPAPVVSSIGSVPAGRQQKRRYAMGVNEQGRGRGEGGGHLCAALLSSTLTILAQTGSSMPLLRGEVTSAGVGRRWLLLAFRCCSLLGCDCVLCKTASLAKLVRVGPVMISLDQHYTFMLLGKVES